MRQPSPKSALTLWRTSLWKKSLRITARHEQSDRCHGTWPWSGATVPERSVHFSFHCTRVREQTYCLHFTSIRSRRRQCLHIKSQAFLWCERMYRSFFFFFLRAYVRHANILPSTYPSSDRKNLTCCCLISALPPCSGCVRARKEASMARGLYD